MLRSNAVNRMNIKAAPTVTIATAKAVISAEQRLGSEFPSITDALISRIEERK